MGYVRVGMSGFGGVWGLWPGWSTGWVRLFSFRCRVELGWVRWVGGLVVSAGLFGALWGAATSFSPASLPPPDSVLPQMFVCLSNPTKDGVRPSSLRQSRESVLGSYIPQMLSSRWHSSMWKNMRRRRRAKLLRQSTSSRDLQFSSIVAKTSISCLTTQTPTSRTQHQELWGNLHSCSFTN